MNQNIEVINQQLWAVRFNYLRYMPELGYSGNYDDADQKTACYTNDGKLVLNKSHEAYHELKQLIQRIMKNNDRELENKIAYMRSKVRDPFDEMYLFALDLEVRRRLISKEYVKGKPFSINNLFIKRW